MTENSIECPLGEMLKIERGGSPRPIKAFLTTKDDGINWIKIGDASNSSKYILKAEQKILSTGLKKSREVFKGDLLLTNSMSFGRPYLVGIHGAIHDGWLVLRDNKFIDKNYLYYFLSSPSAYNQLSEKAKGSTVKNLNIDLVSELNTKVSPLPIQRAIVTKIEELFSSLDGGIADLKKAQEQLNVYRQAVLKKVFDGDWKKLPLSKVCEMAKKVRRREVDENKKLLYLDIGSIDNKSQKIIGHKEFTWKDAPSRAQQIVYKGDILFSTVRTYLKNIAQIEDDIYEGEIASSGFTVIRGKKELMNQRFIFFYTLYQGFLEPLNDLQTGTSYPAVRDKDVFSQIIPVPDLQIQRKIVQNIEEQFSVCEMVEKGLGEGLLKAEALKQSILKKAFEGKLLSEEEIEKCKKENDYEPAEVLLQKIKAEKKKK